MNRDIRACSIPMTEFNHLTLAEVAEFKRLASFRVSITEAGGRNGARYASLLARRVAPDGLIESESAA